MTFRNSRIESKLGRRHFLRGAGGVAIGLPFLLGREGSLSAQGPSAVPERFISVYFGNGMPAKLSSNGFTGVLSPLAQFQDKLTMLRGINATAESSAGGANGHDHGSASFCCAMSTDDFGNKKGQSLDWVAQEALAPATPYKTISAGVFSGKQGGGGKKARWFHSWRGANQPNEPFTNPQTLFKGLMFSERGNMQPDTVDTEAMKRLHLRRKSVLDLVGSEYEAVKAAGYPASTVSLIDDHLTILRGVEKRINDLADKGSANACVLPAAGPDTDAKNGSLNGYMQHWDTLWPLIVDIYVAGLRCDLFRFGNLILTNGGDEFSHSFGGNEAEDIHGDWFHQYDGVGDEKTTKYNSGVEAIIQWEWEHIAYFLKQMNDSAFPDANGKTLLDNSTTFMGTEIATLPHGNENLTYVLAGAQGRFKQGVQEMGGRTDVDMYQTILKAFNIDTKFGDQAHATGLLPILA